MRERGKTPEVYESIPRIYIVITSAIIALVMTRLTEVDYSSSFLTSAATQIACSFVRTAYCSFLAARAKNRRRGGLDESPV